MLSSPRMKETIAIVVITSSSHVVDALGAEALGDRGRHSQLAAAATALPLVPDLELLRDDPARDALPRPREGLGGGGMRGDVPGAGDLAAGPEDVAGDPGGEPAEVRVVALVVRAGQQGDERDRPVLDHLQAVGEPLAG